MVIRGWIECRPNARRVSAGRDKLIIGKRLEGESITQIADSVSVAPSTVFRTLKRLEPELIEELRASGLGLDEETRSFSRV